MRIFLSGLSDEPKELQFSETDAWVKTAVDAVSEDNNSSPEVQPLSLKVSLYKNEDLVVLKGDFKGPVKLLCSRCAVDYQEPLLAHFQCLFTSDSAFLDKNGGTFDRFSSEDDTTDIEFLDKDHIELGDVLKEQLYLKIPLQPLCEVECKGLCPTCGQNQNAQPCQCHRLKMGPLAKGLANIRLDR